jgi:putative ABC transport system permease protein
MFFKLATKSLSSRRGSVLLTVIAMSVSVYALLGVDHIRSQTKDSFHSTVSGIDLIVGARTGSLNLLLYSVFRIGNPTNNIDWHTYKSIISDPKVGWAIPIALGDSHQGYRVVGTSRDYFKHFSLGNKQNLEFAQGNSFKRVFDVVLGSEVAKNLNYTIGKKIVLAHGLGKTSFSLHDDNPFTVVGILRPTGTPVDQSLQVSLEGIEAIHYNSPGSMENSSLENPSTQMRYEPEKITAFMLGLNSRLATFSVQRSINDSPLEPLTAILPGVALSELWQMMDILENTLRLISGLILVAALLGLTAMMLASVRERQREIYLLRVIGAPPVFLFFLIELEALLIGVASILIGGAGLTLSFNAANDFLSYNYGLHIDALIWSEGSIHYALLVISATALAAAIPALAVYQSAKAK